MSNQTDCRLAIGLWEIGGNGQEPLGEACDRYGYVSSTKKEERNCKTYALIFFFFMSITREQKTRPNTRQKMPLAVV